eukprot:m.155177 g.155177  ORF g.155177 m.155177 type:complete len:713 (-) comp14307_c0_seq5:3699-5837(-)
MVMRHLVLSLVLLCICASQVNAKEGTIQRPMDGADGLDITTAIGQGVTSYQDPTEFQEACHKQGLSLVLYEPTARAIQQATQSSVSSSSIYQQELPSPLDFDAKATHLPLSFRLTSKAYQDTGTHTDTDTVPVNSFKLLQQKSDAGQPIDVIQLGGTGSIVTEITFSTLIYHQSTPYSQIFACGLRFLSTGESPHATIQVFDNQGELLLDEPLDATASQHEGFIGVTSSAPIQTFLIRQHSSDIPILASQLAFGVAEINLLDDITPEQRHIFWIGFNLFITLLLVVDMTTGRERSLRLRSALLWTVVWIALAMCFNVVVFVRRGRGPALVWLTSYLLEKFLSVDNLFVFLTIFAAFKTPSRHQHKVLSWGITGAIILRAIFIFTGVLLVEKFSWLLAVFGGFLLYTGIKGILEIWDDENEENSMFSFSSDDDGLGKETAVALNNSKVLQYLGYFIPLSRSYDEKGNFFIPNHASLMLPVSGIGDSTKSSSSHVIARFVGKMFEWIMLPLTCLLRLCKLDRYQATPLFAVLVIVETTDMVFAADSIPAVLSITQDPFVAYTSNIFAVLGLRALYFALAAAMAEFKYLGPALGFILLFIGAKLLLVMVDVHLSVEVTLAVVIVTLAVGIFASLCHPSGRVSQHDRQKKMPSSSSSSSSFIKQSVGSSSGFDPQSQYVPLAESNSSSLRPPQQLTPRFMQDMPQLQVTSVPSTPR